MPGSMPGGLSWPKVSIVTPSYNQGEFIEETIRSVLLQGYPDLEYIIIDGGSTDGSVEIIRKYEPWLACWVGEPDRGQAEALHKGFHRSRGEIIAWLNSDDIYQRGAVSEAVSQFKCLPEIAAVYGDCHIIDKLSKVVELRKARPFSLHYALVSPNPVLQPAAFMKREVLQRVGDINQDLHYVMDWELWLRIGLNHQLRYVPAIWAGFRMGEDNKSVSQAQAFWPERIAVLDGLFQRNDLVPEQVKDMAYRRASFNAGTILLEGGEVEEAVPYLQRSFQDGQFPFGDLSYLMTRIASSVSMVLPPGEAGPVMRVDQRRWQGFLAAMTNRETEDFLSRRLPAGMALCAYKRGELSGARWWAIKALATSVENWLSPHLWTVLAKSLLGGLLGKAGNRLRSPVSPGRTRS